MEGAFRLWAIERSVGSRAVCLGLFDAHTTLSTLKARQGPSTRLPACLPDRCGEHRLTGCAMLLLLVGFGAGGQPSAFTVCWDLSLVLSSNGLSLLESHRIRRKEVRGGR